MRDRLLAAEKVKAIDWQGEALHLLDQRILPFEENWLAYTDADGVAQAIRDMVVRGAPAIGIAAAYGVVLAARDRKAAGGDWVAALEQDFSLLANSRPTAVNLFWALNRMRDRLERMAAGGDWVAALEQDFSLLANSRPTAVNLFWALNRMRDRLERCKDNTDALQALEDEAVAIHESDREANLTMAQLGVDVIRRHQGNAQTVLTHCNTGALATGGFGTALGVIRGAWIEGMIEQVYADETRPWLQGSRLTAWELANEGIPVILNVDSAAAHIMKTKGVTWVIVGADRITANGDVANKIGPYQLLSALTGLPPMVTWQTRSAPINWRSTPCTTVCALWWLRRVRPSTWTWPAAKTFRLKSVTAVNCWKWAASVSARTSRRSIRCLM